MTDEAPPFKLSRETTIRVDAQGGFWHDGQRVTHPGLARSFAQWIDIDPESGRYILRNSVNWAFITVDDAPLVVRAVGHEGDDIVLSLSDGTQEPLRTDTVRVEPGDVPYCDVRGGKLPARFLPQAAFTLLELLGDVPLRHVAKGEGARRA
jgi:uncharacterized protein